MNNSLSKFTAVVIKFLEPLYLLAFAFAFVPGTVFQVVTTIGLTKVRSWSDFREIWFARFWSIYGPLSAQKAAPVIRSLLANAEGVILDIGTGQGHMLSLYASEEGPNGLQSLNRIKKIYAVEPNKSHHSQLRENARRAGLEQKLEIVAEKIEELESKAQIPRHYVDTVVTLQVLCSIPDPDILIPELRTFLKPGGKWIAYEHVKRDAGLVSWWQAILNLVWPQFFNGCQLNRDTAQTVAKTGRWKGGETLKLVETESPWAVIPSVKGVLISES